MGLEFVATRYELDPRLCGNSRLSSKFWTKHVSAWTASALRNYYLNPEIVYSHGRHRTMGSVLSSEEGHYVVLHEPD